MYNSCQWIKEFSVHALPDEEEHSVHFQVQHSDVSKFISKRKPPPQPKINLKITPIPKKIYDRAYQPSYKKCYDELGEDYEQLQAQSDRLVYKKFQNQEVRAIGGINYFASAFIDLNKIQKLQNSLLSLKQIFPETSFHNPKSPRFDSNFQSGNLFCVFKVHEEKGRAEYNLVLQNDLNSKGYTQWFYFSISDVASPCTIKFNIVNLMKSDSLFNFGLLPAVYSQKKQKKSGVGWHRAGSQVSYFRNNYRREDCNRYYYTLTFTYEFRFQKDLVYFAHSFPYTLSDFKNFIRPIQQHPYKSKLLKASPLCTSLGGNKVQQLVINQGDLKQKRKSVIIICRQHAGQTPSSFVLEGIINFLLNKSKQAQFLRKNYTFRIIPFMNLDGVLIGNYRCSIAGIDPNRRWDSTNKQLFPQILAVKKIASQLSKEKKLKFILDLHGHSRCMKSFFYGNPAYNKQLPKVFPLICSRINPDISYAASTFTSPPEKRTTARVVLGSLAGPASVCTHQTSFFGTIREDKKKHFTQQDMRQIGWDLSLGIYHLCFQDFNHQKKLGEKTLFYKTLYQLKENTGLASVGDQDLGSDSDPQENTVNKQLMQPLLSVRHEFRSLVNQQSRRRSATFKQTKCQRKCNLMLNFRFLQMGKVLSIAPQNKLMALQPVSLMSDTKKKQRKGSIAKRPSSTYKARNSTSQKLDLLIDGMNSQFFQYNGLHCTKSSNCKGRSPNKQLMVRNAGWGVQEQRMLVKSNLLYN